MKQLQEVHYWYGNSKEKIGDRRTFERKCLTLIDFISSLQVLYIVKPNFITLSSLILALKTWMFSSLGPVVSIVALWNLTSDFWQHQSKAHLSIVFSTELRFIIIWRFPFVQIWRVCWAISTPLWDCIKGLFKGIIESY